MAKNYADNEMLPHAAKWDEEQIFPVDVKYYFPKKIKKIQRMKI